MHNPNNSLSFVLLSDSYCQKLKVEKEEISAKLESCEKYCQNLIDFGNLPCLPKDLENLREANGKFAQDNFKLLELCEDLNAENKDLINELSESLDYSSDLANRLFSARQERAKAEEWAVKCALESFQLKEEIKGWKNKWECAVEMAAIAENKLAEKENRRKS